MKKKKIYLKPQTCVIAVATSELCKFSKWTVDHAEDGTTTLPDCGNVTYDNKKLDPSEDPWNSDNW